jgi:hypothetical protein
MEKAGTTPAMFLFVDYSRTTFCMGKERKEAQIITSKENMNTAAKSRE